MTWGNEKLTTMAPPTSEFTNFLPHSTTQLAKQCNVPLALLDAIVARAIDPYVEFQIRKNTNGFRTIAAPIAEYRPVLQTILGYLKPDFLHPAAFAYVQGRSVVNCAKVHEGMSWGVKVDIKDFFGSINEDMVYRSLTSIQVDGKRARLIAALCTRISAREPGVISKRHGDLEPVFGAAKRRFKRLGVLPQGSPTSGFLANLVASDIDSEISAFCRHSELQYTRYSDDIVISSKYENFDREYALKIVAFIRATLNSKGFTLNTKKTRIMSPGSRKQVLGLLVDEPGVRLTKEKRRKIEATLRGIELFGLQAHAEHNIRRSGFEESSDVIQTFMNHFWGQVAYVIDVDKKFAQHILKRIVTISQKEPYFSADTVGKAYAQSAMKLMQCLAPSMTENFIVY